VPTAVGRGEKDVEAGRKRPAGGLKRKSGNDANKGSRKREKSTA